MVLRKRQQTQPGIIRFGKKSVIIDSENFFQGPLSRPLNEVDIKIADNIRENTGKFWTVFNTTSARRFEISPSLISPVSIFSQNSFIPTQNISVQAQNIFSPLFNFGVQQNVQGAIFSSNTLEKQKFPTIPAIEASKEVLKISFEKIIRRSSEIAGTKFGTQVQDLKLEPNKRFFSLTNLTRTPDVYNRKLWEAFITGNRDVLSDARQQEIERLLQERERLQQRKKQLQTKVSVLQNPEPLRTRNVARLDEDE